MYFSMKLTDWIGAVRIMNCEQEILNNVMSDLAPYIDFSNKEVNTEYIIECKRGDKENISFIDNNHIIITWTSEKVLFKLLRKVARSFFYNQLEAMGWVQIHAAGIVNEKNEVFLFAGDKGAGKTSSSLTCVKRMNGIKLVSNDRILINKYNNFVIGWPTAIGIGKVAKEKLEIKDNGYEVDGKHWFWPRELRQIGMNIAKGGMVKRIIVPEFKFEGGQECVKKQVMNAREILMQNIRYDALVEEHYWQLPRKNKHEYGTWLCDTEWCENVTAIKIESGGISEKYYEALLEEVESE